MPRFDPSWEEAGQEDSPENPPPEVTWRETGENPDQPGDTQALPSWHQAETYTSALQNCATNTKERP